MKQADLIGDTDGFYAKFWPDIPKLTPNRLQWRLNFLKEEMQELEEAINLKSPEEVVDGIVDIMVVALGTLKEADVDIAKAWEVVAIANMAKERGESKRPGSGGHDLMKPPGWKAPDHSDNVGTLPEVFGRDRSTWKREDQPPHTHDTSQPGFPVKRVIAP